MMIARLAIGLTLSACLLLFSDSLSAADPTSDAVLFNRDVRPILSDHCFACHGPDANRREADLRLDTQEGLTGVVHAGQTDQSELWRRIAEAEGEERMPPAGFGKDLSPEARETLRRWIEQGAAWEGHWSFQPVTRPEVPEVAEANPSASNEIDAFVLQGLREQGLELQKEADRRTLIRRLSLDLTGLPPTPEQVERFLADTAPGAYERLVDTLLESPHYGERMAMMWLDLVRYADSVGYHGDQEVSISPYRDYVIDSFNENVPFDRFTIEQLAGDLLPTPTTRQRIASGYNRLGMMSAEGGVQPKEYLAKYIAERVRNLGGTWMGVTLGCCECHDHKYDPFSAKDFYAFEAFFADIQEQGLYSGAHGTANWGSNAPVPTPEQQAQLEAFDRELGELRQSLVAETPELQAEREAWERSLPTWTVLRPRSMTSDGNTTLTLLDDGSILASGENPAKDVYRLAFDTIPAGVTGIRIEVLPDDSFPQRGPGRAGNGNFVLSELLARTIASGQPTSITFSSASATYEQTGAAGGNPYGKWAVAAAIDGDAKGPTWGWAVMEQVGRPHAAVFEAAQPLAGGEGVSLELDLLQQLDNPQHNIGRFRVSVTTATPPLSATVVPAEVAEALAVPAPDRSDAQRQTIAAHHRTIASSLTPIRERIATLEKERQALDNGIPRTLVTQTVEPRMVRVLNRGNWMDESGEIVQPAFPAFLPGSEMPTDRRLTRLDLAHWLVHPDHPLTSRVFVNRLWKQFFGAGLSRKLDDLGSQGEWPSHPELLDWLATRFIDSGWNVKEMVRTIVTSAAYRQSSLSDAERDERDPFNRWLSHQSRFRVDAEMVRDTALRVSGLLVERLGGPSVRPYQPVGYWSYLNFPTREWQQDSGEKLYRRGIYTHWQRQYLHPSLLAFDAPSREECTADRPRSNTPLQSLVLLNDPIYVEAARVFAERIMREGGETFENRVAWAYARTLSREPREAELGVLKNLWQRHRDSYAADAEGARQLTSIGAAPVANDLDLAELAAWTSVARTLLNLHETITRN